MLDCEFTVVEGPHAKRKFWQMFTVQGGKVDENGVSIGWNISKSTFRAMIDSALGLDPQDMSETAKAEAHPARPCRSQRHHVRRQDQGRAERGCPLWRSEPPRPRGAADREGMEARDGGQGRAREPEPIAKRRTEVRGASLVWSRPAERTRHPERGQPRSRVLRKRPVHLPGRGAPATGAKPAGPAWLNG